MFMWRNTAHPNVHFFLWKITCERECAQKLFLVLKVFFVENNMWT